MATSLEIGKFEVCSMIRNHIPRGAKILDVGAGDGTWRRLLPDYYRMDACEIFFPNVEKIKLMYNSIFCGNIIDYEYRYYDLVIFGDVIEHMEITQAQKVLKYAITHSDTVIVAVPFLYSQGEMEGNKWEEHLQDDLTPEVFKERYPWFKVLYKAADNYWYYIFRKGVD